MLYVAVSTLVLSYVLARVLPTFVIWPAPV